MNRRNILKSIVAAIVAPKAVEIEPVAVVQEFTGPRGELIAIFNGAKWQNVVWSKKPENNLFAGYNVTYDNFRHSVVTK